MELWKKNDNHPAIAKVIELWISEGTLFIVSQRAKGIELGDVHNKMTETMLARVAQRTITGLLHLLRNNLITTSFDLSNIKVHQKDHQLELKIEFPIVKSHLHEVYQ